MNYDNDHLVYPNLVSAHIKTSNASAPSTTSVPQPPPASSILKRIEEMPAYQRPSMERYKFDVEREVLERAKKRGDEAGEGPVNESVELDLAGVVDEKCSVTDKTINTAKGVLERNLPMAKDVLDKTRKVALQKAKEMDDKYRGAGK